MAQRTEAQALALWRDLRANYPNLHNETGMGDEALLAFLLLGTDGTGGAGTGPSASDIGTEVSAKMKASSQPVSATALPLPTGAATETTLDGILTQLKNDRTVATQSFIDSTDTMYLKVLAFNSTTNAYESATLKFDGTAYTPTPPERPLTAADFDTIETVWDIVTAGTGYSVGDVVSQFTFLKQGPPAEVAATLWYNQTTGAALASAPLAGHRRRVSSLVATETTLSALNTKVPAQGVAASSASIPVVIASNDAQFGNKSTAATLPTGGLGLLGWVSDAYRLILSAFTQSSAPFSKISDGTNTATVKAASTAAVAADTAIVTTLSPSSAPAKTVVVDSTNSFEMPTGDTTSRTIMTSSGNSLYLAPTGNTIFSTAVGDNVLTVGAGPTGNISPSGRHYGTRLFRLIGNTNITAGSVELVGATDVNGPWVRLPYSLDGGVTILNAPLVVPSNAQLDVLMYNPAGFKYTQCRVLTAFTGPDTGARVEYAYGFPIGIMEYNVAAAAISGVSKETQLPATLGPKPSNDSLSVVLAPNQTAVTTAAGFLDLSSTLTAGYVSALGLNVLTGTLDGVPIIQAGAMYKGFYIRLEGNTGITGGAVAIEGAYSPAGPWQPMPATTDQGITTNNSPITILSSQIYEALVINSSNFTFVRVRVSTAFTGATTGVKATGLTLYPQESTPSLLRVNDNITHINGTPISTGVGQNNAGCIRVINANLVPIQYGETVVTTPDFSFLGRLRGLKLLNENAIRLYVGLYLSAVPVATGDVPYLGLVWRVPANSDFTLGVGDFGEMGKTFPTNTRVGISTTRATFTPPTAPQLAACSLNFETV